MIYADSTEKRLVYVQAKANEAFWDDLWKDDDLRNYIMNAAKSDRFVPLVTRLFIPQSDKKKVIDAGCGKGQYVYSLQSKNYDSYGIDFAPKIVSAINQAFPELKVRVGDVRSMPFPNAYFDGYWSLGVIEHFYTGYASILEEMGRVIKPGGFLFITFPYMSPLRRLKLFFGHYPELKQSDQGPDGFYQFALNHRKVRRDIIRYGFKPLLTIPLDGFNGLKNELNSRTVTQLFHLLQKSKHLVLRVIRHFLYFVLLPISGHSILLVFKKR